MSASEPEEIQPGVYRELDPEGDDISEEEAEMDIDLLDLSSSLPRELPPVPVIASEDSTPSVREAADRAADILRQLRGE